MGGGGMGDKLLPEQEIQRRRGILSVWIKNDEISMVLGNSSRIQHFGNEAAYTGIFFPGLLELFLWCEIYSFILDFQVIKPEQDGSNVNVSVIFKS